MTAAASIAIPRSNLGAFGNVKSPVRRVDPKERRRETACAKMRTDADIVETMDVFADTVIRVCASYFGSRPERDDAFQETFLKYSLYQKPFADQNHKKAWLITVASNICRDMLRKSETKTDLVDDFDDNANACWTSPVSGDNTDPRMDALSLALSVLDDKSRLIMYLMYYEEMSGSEIAEVMNMSENAVYVNASRARKKMKEVLSR